MVSHVRGGGGGGTMSYVGLCNEDNSMSAPRRVSMYTCTTTTTTTTTDGITKIERFRRLCVSYTYLVTHKCVVMT